MKFKNCFIGGKNSVWKTESLIELSKNLPIFRFNITKISLNEIIRWRIIYLKDYVNHYKRVKESDLSIPIILRSDGYVMDGWHRIIKALSKNKTTLPARQFEIDPKPDFKIGG